VAKISRATTSRLYASTGRSDVIDVLLRTTISAFSNCTVSYSKSFGSLAGSSTQSCGSSCPRSKMRLSIGTLLPFAAVQKYVRFLRCSSAASPMSAPTHKTADGPLVTFRSTRTPMHPAGFPAVKDRHFELHQDHVRVLGRDHSRRTVEACRTQQRILVLGVEIKPFEEMLTISLELIGSVAVAVPADYTRSPGLCERGSDPAGATGHSDIGFAKLRSRPVWETS
jgi:hypothetical protein